MDRLPVLGFVGTPSPSTVDHSIGMLGKSSSDDLQMDILEKSKD